MIRTRIAPSPTGFPHVCTLFQVLFDYVLAHQSKGQFVFRIEDTDQTRKVDGAEEALYAALEWAGLIPDEGPKYGGSYGPYRQSERLDLYHKYAQQLIEQGDAYYCFCSSERLDEVRKQMQKDGVPMYDKHCRHMDSKQASEKSKHEPHVIRMKIPANETITFTDEIRGQISFDSNTVDDQVILKSDGFPTYHLGVVVDDHLMEITHMIRGEEWISSAPKHVLLYRYFGWDMPKMIHTPLLRNPDKSKLAKRHGHASVTWYQEQGYLPQALLNFLATRVWNHPDGEEVFSLAELIEKFEVSQMHIQGPIVDLNKLNWYNGLYIRQLDNKDLFTYLRPFASKDLLDSQLKQMVPLIKERLVKLSDVNGLTDFVYQYQAPEEKILLKRANSDLVFEQLDKSIFKLEELSIWTVANFEQVIRQLQEVHDWHLGQYFMMLRLAVTGKSATPPLFETIEVVGKENTIDRLRAVRDNLSIMQNLK